MCIASQTVGFNTELTGEIARFMKRELAQHAGVAAYRFM